MAIYIVRNAERASSEEMYEGFKNNFEVLDLEGEENDDEQ